MTKKTKIAILISPDRRESLREFKAGCATMATVGKCCQCGSVAKTNSNCQ